MKYFELWLLFIPLIIAIILGAIKNAKANNGIKAIKEIISLMRNKKFTNNDNYSAYIIDRFYKMAQEYLSKNTYAAIRNYGMDSRTVRDFSPIMNQNLEPRIDLLLIMQRCFVTIDAIGVHGRVTISPSSKHKEVLTVKNTEGEIIPIRDNIYAPYHYQSFFEKYILRYILVLPQYLLFNSFSFSFFEKYFIENDLVPRKRFDEFFSGNLFYQILIVGKDAIIEDAVPGKSSMLKKEFNPQNTCYIVRSEEEAFRLVDSINQQVKSRNIFDRNGVIHVINTLQEEGEYL